MLADLPSVSSRPPTLNDVAIEVVIAESSAGSVTLFSVSVNKVSSFSGLLVVSYLLVSDVSNCRGVADKSLTGV